MSIDFSLSNGVATILLNRPEKLNALTDAMWDQLSGHLDRCQRDDSVRAVLLAGAGRGFCAGADLSGQGRKERRKGLRGSLEAMNEYDDVIRRLYHLDKPTIAAVRGPVVGIAWTMVLCCDWVLVTESAQFRPAFLNLAKVPEGGIIYLMARLVGQLKARDIIYRSHPVTGAQAAQIGLASRLVAEDALMEEALVLSGELAAGPPLAFALTKRLFNVDASSFDAFLRQELNAIAIGANTEDAVEGRTAFLGKRPPRYTGQ